MKTFKDIQEGDSIFQYNIDDRVPFERFNVVLVEKYQRVVNEYYNYGCTRIVAHNPKTNEEVKLDISDYYIDKWVYDKPGEVFISDLEEVISHEKECKNKLKEDFYNNINRCNRNIEYAEKFLQGLDETFTSESTNIQVGDKIRFLESGNEYVVLNVKEDGALYVAKYFNGIRHLDIRPEELKDIEKVF